MYHTNILQVDYENNSMMETLLKIERMMYIRAYLHIFENKYIRRPHDVKA